MSRIKEMSKEKYLEFLNKSNKEILSSLKIDHKPLYTEEDITPENEKWIRVLMKADKIFDRLEEGNKNEYKS